MSWQAADWMDSLPYDVMKPLAARVLLKLANVAAQDGTRAYRSTWEVADELGVDRRSIQRALRELEQSELIVKGDQRAVGHIRPDRRPTVYNLNFGWHTTYAQPELPLPDDDDDGATDGATPLSTGSYGATNGATTAVALGTNGTYLTQHTQESYVPDRAQAHEEIDASGGSHRPASAPGSPVWSEARCPANERKRVHQLGSYGKCIHCHERPLPPFTHTPATTGEPR
jgi:hypothetical protein